MSRKSSPTVWSDLSVIPPCDCISVLASQRLLPIKLTFQNVPGYPFIFPDAIRTASSFNLTWKKTSVASQLYSSVVTRSQVPL